jgi:hypothetical protein
MPALREYLASFRELMPTWLSAFSPTTGIEKSHIVRQFLKSRTVFYPGSGSDGGPIAAFNTAHAAHCYIYVDYMKERADLIDELRRDGFRGYATFARIELRETDLGAGDWNPHLNADEVRMLFRPVAPYGFIHIFQRNLGLAEEHGAERFAVLFLAADGIATYDALFCQKNSAPVPFCIVLQDHGFGGNYDRFGRGGLMERIARQANRLPRFLLVGDQCTVPWNDYAVCEGADPEV